MAQIDTTSIPAALKINYSDEMVRWMTYTNRPLLGLIPKRTDYEGSQLTNFMLYGDSSSGSSSFSTAVTTGGAPPSTGFSIKPVPDYMVPQVDNLTAKLTRSNKGAFMAALKIAMNGAINELATSTAISLTADGTGARGTIGVITGNTIQLTDPNQAVNFVGDPTRGTYCQFGYVAAASSTWALRNTGQIVQCTSIDRNGGLLTFSAGLPSGTAVGDIIVRQGDLPSGLAYNNGAGTTSGSRFCGLSGFLPIQRPTYAAGDSFGGGVNRGADSNRLAGNFFDASSGMSMKTAINGAMALGDRESAEYDVLVCNQKRTNDIVNEFEAETVIVNSFDEPEIGYTVNQINAFGRKVKLITDRTLPSDRAFTLTLDTWTLWSVDGPPYGVLTYDNYGEGYLPASAADALQIRCGGYSFLECAAPGKNGVIYFGSTF